MPTISRPARLVPPTALLAGLALIVAVASPAQENPPTVAREATAADDTDRRKINGIFDTDLPKTEQKGSVRFIIHPHPGDFTSRRYLRIPVGVRRGVNDHVEFTATVEGYVEHGLKSGSPGHRIGDVKFGGKYEFRHWLKPDYDASVGFNARRLVGRPPVDLTDGYNHYTPYLVALGTVSEQ